MSDKPLVNRVAQSKLITLDLEKYYPETPFYALDLKDYLFKELILREKDFRDAMASFDTSVVTGQVVGVFCSTDAIIPTWAYMLAAVTLAPHAVDIIYGNEEDFLKLHFKEVANTQLKPIIKEDGMYVLKGCSKKEVPISAYVEVSKLLQPLAKSIMFGEPCSTVPIYKKPRK